MVTNCQSGNQRVPSLRSSNAGPVVDCCGDFLLFCFDFDQQLLEIFPMAKGLEVFVSFHLRYVFESLGYALPHEFKGAISVFVTESGIVLDHSCSQCKDTGQAIEPESDRIFSPFVKASASAVA